MPIRFYHTGKLIQISEVAPGHFELTESEVPADVKSDSEPTLFINGKLVNLPDSEATLEQVIKA